MRKYHKGDKGGTEQGDPSNPGLEFTLVITGHPTYEGKEMKLYHPLAKTNEQFLLNTLMCLVPDKPWQQNGIKVPLSELTRAVVGRPVNGLVDWKIEQGYKDSTKKFVKNELTSLKKFDGSITQPMPTEGNPPVIINEPASGITQQAAGGVSPGEVNEFLNQWPGGTPSASTPAPAEGNFFSDPF
jgi:hypothetical protein